MKTDRSAIFSVFALMLLVILIANLGALDLSPFPASTPVPPTGTPLPSATATPAYTPTLTPTITPTPQAVFLFDRDSFPSCMKSQLYDGFRSYSLGGKLHMEISTSEYEYLLCEEREFSDIVMEADITLVDATPADVQTGFIFRYTESDYEEKFLEFGLTDGYAILSYYDSSQDNSWTTLMDYTPVPVFNQDSSNHLKLVAVGDTLVIFVNGAFIGQVQDSHLSAGSVGVSLTNWAPEQTQYVVYENMTLLDLSAPKLLYVETDFVNGGCFGEQSGDGFEAFAQDGQYHINLAADNDLLVPCEGAGLETLTDFVLEANVVQQDAGNPSLAFRTNADSGAMYVFQIDPAGYAILVYIPNATDSPKILMDWTPVEGVAAVGGVNHIKVIAAGETILIYVNDSRAAEVQDGSAAGGGIALRAQALDSDFHVIFDHVKITSLVAP